MKKFISIPFVLLMAILYIQTSCNSTVDVTSVATTGELTEVTTTSAKCSGSVLSAASSQVIDCGICWSNTPDPTINGNAASSLKNAGSFTCKLTDLMPDITYHVRAYAVTAEGTEYGKTILLTTPNETGSLLSTLNTELSYEKVTDIENNEYHTIVIGTQTWMVENLRVTKFRNGEIIPNVTDNTKWTKLKTSAQCTYNNNSEANSIRKYGRLYNYYAVKDTRNIAPEGWHVATTADWASLITYINNNKGVAKSVAQAMATKTDWAESQFLGATGALDLETYMNVNNTSGLAALPCGLRADYGQFSSVGVYCAWWIPNEIEGNNAGFRSLNNYGAIVGENYYNQTYGLSVRCVKD
jgi:uncharacterized protein (TIGR02145 family)